MTLDQADPDAVARVPTWDQVNAIFQRQCVPCHPGSGGLEEDGFVAGAAAPEGSEPGLETCENIIKYFPNSYRRIFETNDMPPGAWPRLTSEEKLIIQRWFDAGEDAPCK